MVSASLLLLLLLCSVHPFVAHAAGDAAHSIYEVLATGSAKAEALCAEPRGTPSPSTRATVPLNRRYGRCSPGTSASPPTVADLLRLDQLRFDYLQRKLHSGTDELSVPTTLGSFVGTLEYVVTVGIGSPAVTQTLIMDTGSDLSWVHCRSTSGSNRVFDPTTSSTYSAFSCTSPECIQLGQAGNGCLKADCQYAVHYGDGSSTFGTYGSDRLALGGSEPTVIDDFQFGCGHDGAGFQDQTDGLLGLGGNAQSLASQTAATYGNTFSYCLPPTPLFSGFLTLGAPSNTSGFVTAPMVRNAKVPTFYFIFLQSIIVAGTELSITPSVFSGGSIVDSGTVVTRLPPTAYSALSAAFRANMTQYPLTEPKSLLDTCFDISGHDYVMIPSVALVFDGGAVVYLDANGIMLENCLAFAATDEDGSTGIVGNVQQRSFEVLYDVGRNLFGFRPKAC